MASFFFAVVGLQANCRYFRNEKDLGTGTVCTSNPLIDPASMFATGSFYLTIRSYVCPRNTLYL